MRPNCMTFWYNSETFKAMPAITEQEMMEARPDTSVRSLDEYGAAELLSLNLAVSYAFETSGIQDLKLWGERISNAYREAVKRENALPF